MNKVPFTGLEGLGTDLIPYHWTLKSRAQTYLSKAALTLQGYVDFAIKIPISAYLIQTFQFLESMDFSWS